MIDQEYQPTPKSNPMAIISLIAGILSVLIVLSSFCFLRIIGSSIGLVLGIVALILGLVAKKRIKLENGLPSQSKLATAGFILGIAGIVLGLIALIIGIIVWVTQMAMIGSPVIEQQFQEILNQLETP